MSDAIQGLLQLQERWPDFFELIRSLNGFETALSEERIAEISQQIDADADGMQILGDCMAILTDPDRSTPDERDWLRKNGLGAIVKNEITVKFGLNEDNKAEQYASLARGQGYEPDRKIAVHAGTLRTTLRDYHQKGGSIPAELFTTFEGNQTHIKTKN